MDCYIVTKLEFVVLYPVVCCKTCGGLVCFGGLWHHMVQYIVTNILEDPAASIFKDKLVNMYQTAWCQNPKYHNRENLGYDIMGI
jgi:hypothetical protein